MLKIDVLGLRTLTVIHDAVGMVAERHGVTLDMNALDLEDPRVYQLLGSGRTAGVFQFESPLATDCLRNMKVRSLRRSGRDQRADAPRPARHRDALVFINRQARPGAGPLPPPRGWRRSSSPPTA